MQCIMENIKTCELCREQIIKTEDFENLNCDEKQNLNILKNLEITVSRNANICSNCVNVSHLTYNFKTSCLTNNDHLKTLIRRSINDKLILEEVVMKEAKSEFKNEEKVCRFCLNFSEVNSLVDVNLEQDAVLKDMLERCLPEIDTNLVQNPLICCICSELLEKLFNFISWCKYTERLDTKSDVIVNENTLIVTVANHDDNIHNSFNNEENCESIENPELHIKSEDFYIDEDIKDSIDHSNRLLKEGEIHTKPSSFPSGGSHQEIHWRTSKSTISKFFKCSECLFQFTRQSSLVMHKKNNKKAYKCSAYKCGFTATTKCKIVKHKTKSHNIKRCLSNGGILTFSCNLCPYQTNEKFSIKTHNRVHQNLADTELFKCPKCSYVTKWRHNLDSHNIRCHEDISKFPKYKCDECPYETIWRLQLVKHKITHRDPSEVKMYKCAECLYETKRKSSLQTHVKMHAKNRQKAVKVEQSRSNLVGEKDAKSSSRGTIKEKKFVCDICLYQTYKMSKLRQHCIIHKKPWEVNLFRCDYCPFVTKWKHSVTVHTRRHKNPSELQKYKCNDCTFETNLKRQLVKHVLLHKDPSQVNMYKCKVCPYQTKYKHCILIHEKQHQVEIYTCDECSYKTESKTSFVLHFQNHKKGKQPANSSQNLKKVQQYKCSECYHVAVKKSQLIKHQRTHKDPSERDMYNCTECSFQALWKITLQRHYRKHHSSLEEPFGKVKTFRCNECDFETMYRTNISNHLQAHKQQKMTPSEKKQHAR